MISIETLLRKPFGRLCEKANIDLENPAIKLLRQIFIFLLFTFSCVLFRAQSVAEVGVAFRQMFTAWGIGKEYTEAAMNALGMDTEQILQLAVFITGMAVVYIFTRDEKPSDALPIYKSIAKAENSINASIFVYGIFAVVLCWFALLANSGVSGFQYFQF